jgi:hypothetical protein
MNLIPIIPDLVQDNSVIIWNHMNGPSRYRISMVDHTWHSFAVSKTVPLLCIEHANTAIANIDILSIVRSSEIVNRYNLMYSICARGNLELVNIIIKKGASDWTSGFLGACRFVTTSRDD